jgi:hypothetical protein
VLEGQRFRAGPLARDLERVRIDERRAPLDVIDLPLLRELAETAGQLVDDLR